MLLLYAALANARRQEELIPKICPLTNKVAIYPDDCADCKHEVNCQEGDIIRKEKNEVQ